MGFTEPRAVTTATLLLDSALHRRLGLSLHNGCGNVLTTTPDVMPKAFRLEALVDDEWRLLNAVLENRQRLVRVPVERNCRGLRFTLDETWGAETSRVYAFYAD